MNDEQLLRYSRHILLDEIGIEAQERLLDSTALVLGAGGLGSPAALYLAAAGVGRILLADGDTVDLTNLQRQILHTAERVGMAKTASARHALAALNPGVEVIALPRLCPPADTHTPAAIPSGTPADTPSRSTDNACARPPSHEPTQEGASTAPPASTQQQPPASRAGQRHSPAAPRPPSQDRGPEDDTCRIDASLMQAVAQADVVLDCSDNFATRHALNHACVQAGRPLVSGAAIRFDGQLAVFDTREPSSPCYHCLFPDGESVEDVRCAQMGVFAPLTGIIGTMQAAEALKLAGGFGTPMTGRLLLLDGRTMRFTDIRVPRDPACPVCRQREAHPGH